MPLPRLTPENYRLILGRAFKNSSSTLPDATIFLKTNLMIVDLLLQVEKRSGLVMIFDCKEVSASLTPILISASKRLLALTNVRTSKGQNISLTLSQQRWGKDSSRDF